jgi:UDP-glucose 4-epimerase
MKTLVTGGVGFIGTNLVKRLLKDGHEVTSIDNYSTGFKENEQEGCKYYNLDLANETYIYNLPEEYDVIYHMAALARIQPSIDKPHPAIKNNFLSTLNILEYARTRNIRVVYAGSSSIHHGIYESPYAWSKFSGEDLCKLYGNVYNMESSICRFYNVYGDYQIKEGTYATVLGIFQNQYENEEPLTIVGDGEQRRDFTHVDDIVDGIIRSSEQEFYGEIFELGRGVNHSINEVASMFDIDGVPEGFGTEYPKEYIEQRPGEYDVTLADYSHAQKVLGWKPTKNLEDYMEKYINETN